MRLAVYTDYVYRADASGRYGERAFVVFLEALRAHSERLVLIGRLDPRPGTSHYRLDDETELVGLPHYSSLARPWSVAASLARSVALLWRALAGVDVVWVLGPYPHSVLLALVTILRRRRLVLGVRQDMPAYVRSRRPDQRWMHLGADLLEATWRVLARRHPVVVVGPELAARYRRARRLLPISVSVVSSADVLAVAPAIAARDYTTEVTVLSVGRLDAEKNPLLLAEIVRLLPADPGWRLIVCGDGPLRARLKARIAALGLTDRIDLLGYVPAGAGLLDLYRTSDIFLHVSLTEGFPQVIVEAFASCLPVVATAVGGVPAAADGAAVLVPVDDATAAADALVRVSSDAALRERLVRAGRARALACTRESVSGQVARFLAEPGSTATSAGQWGKAATRLQRDRSA